MNLRLIHYSFRPLIHKPRSVVQNHGEGINTGTGVSMKPRGLWVSGGDGDDSWRAWCEVEHFHIWEVLHKTEILLSPTANILWIKTIEEIDAFHESYNNQQDFERHLLRQYEIAGYPSVRSMFIDWAKVAKDYDGIVIAPYLWGRRLEGPAQWYYGWDCASGCIWNADAIIEVRPYDASFWAVLRRAAGYLKISVHDIPRWWRLKLFYRRWRSGAPIFDFMSPQWAWMVPPVIKSPPPPPALVPTKKISVKFGGLRFPLIVDPRLAKPVTDLFRVLNNRRRGGR